MSTRDIKQMEKYVTSNVEVDETPRPSMTQEASTDKLKVNEVHTPQSSDTVVALKAGDSEFPAVSGPASPIGRKKTWEGLSISSLQTWARIKPVSLCFKNLTYRVKGEEKDTVKTILEGISGIAHPGHILAILGPSGAGKTTLMKILSGQLQPSEGELFYEGKPKGNELSDQDPLGYDGNAAVVDQNEHLLGSLTVRDTIRYAAYFKMSDEAVLIEQRVDHILQYLGLSHCADVKIGTVFQKGISGGEKRRVAIGAELVTQPALLFFDEVTSGLDATSAYAVMNVAHKLGELNHTVIMTIHQPSTRIFEYLTEWGDYLMILEGGRLMYTGKFQDSNEFFSKCGFPVPKLMNPADHYLDVVNSQFQESSANATCCYDKFREMLLPDLNQEIDSTVQSCNEENRVVIARHPFYKQVLLHLQRNFENHLKNPTVFLLRIALYGALCFYLGTLYWKIGDQQKNVQDRAGILFFVSAFLTFMSVSAMPAFVSERFLFIRERMNIHYSTESYCVANFISSIPWLFCIAFVCTFLIYFMVESRLGADKFFTYLGILFSVLITVESMMMMISAVSPAPVVGLAVGASVLGIYMVVCGYFLVPKHIPPYFIWVHFGLSFHTYGFRSFMYNDFKGLNTIAKYGANGIDGDSVLETYSMDKEIIGVNVLILFVMTFAYRVGFYLLLRYFNKTLK